MNKIKYKIQCVVNRLYWALKGGSWAGVEADADRDDEYPPFIPPSQDGLLG